MKLIKHTSYIYEYIDFVDEKICDELTELVETAHIPFDIWERNRSHIRNNQGIDMTSSRLYHDNIQRADDISHKVFSEVHKSYLTDCRLLSFVFSRHKIDRFESSYTYRKYDQSDYYDWHMDDDENKHNLISYIWYLNDDFSGGNLLFLNDNISIKPKKGSLLCFPCGMQWIHKSTKITTGTKKIVWTCFFKGEQ